MKLNLKGKTVVVTGAAGGMGLATIKLLLDYNVKILALDIQKPTKKILHHKKVTYCQINLVNEGELKKAINHFIKNNKRIEKSEKEEKGGVFSSKLLAIELLIKLKKTNRRTRAESQ